MNGLYLPLGPHINIKKQKFIVSKLKEGISKINLKNTFTLKNLVFFLTNEINEIVFLIIKFLKI